MICHRILWCLIFLSWLLLFSQSQATELSQYFYKQSEFVIVYYKEGDDAPPLDDNNHNDIPDRVENIAIQLKAIRELYHQLYNFPDPLTSVRYTKKQPETIEVVIRNREKMKSNGLAFSESTKSIFNPQNFSLKIHIANTIEPKKNLTPAHEYFHLIQYGSTYFRNAWFLEGMARWSEDSMGTRTNAKNNLHQLMQDSMQIEQLFKESYRAEQIIWTPLSVACGDKNHIPQDIQQKYHYLDASPVFKDDVFYGVNVMQKVLHCLHKQESRAVNNFENRKDWIKNGQRSSSNNPFILQCVQTILTQCKK